MVGGWVAGLHIICVLHPATGELGHSWRISRVYEVYTMLDLRYMQYLQ